MPAKRQGRPVLSRRRRSEPRLRGERSANHDDRRTVRKFTPTYAQELTGPRHRTVSSTVRMLSATFVAALATSEVPAYRLARAVGMSPTWLSRKVRGRRRVRAEDYGRLLAIGRRLGLSPERLFNRSGSRWVAGRGPKK